MAAHLAVGTMAVTEAGAAVVAEGGDEGGGLAGGGASVAFGFAVRPSVGSVGDWN